MEYTKDQLKVIKHKDGPAIVIACPGSGKTTTLIARLDYMTKHHKIAPEKIVAVTFTKAAAESMEKRYEEKGAVPGVLFCTIHSLCYNMLIQSNLMRGRGVVDSWEVFKLFEKLIPEKKKNRYKEQYINSIVSAISYVKNADINYTVFSTESFTNEEFKRYYTEYETFKEDNNKIDFDDMIVEVRDELKTNPEFLAHWQKRFDYVMIDEFQDTNIIQSEIFRSMTAIHKNICVVGDDDQSIYGFRSADSSIMLNFDREYVNCRKIYLDTNYRSNKAIIHNATQLIDKNKTRFAKEFKGFREEEGHTLFLDDGGNPVAEAETVIKIAKELIDKGVKPSEIAVLYRNNKLSNPIISQCTKYDIPYISKEKIDDIYTDVVFKDIQAYYELSKNIVTNFKRIMNRPKRYIPKQVYCNEDKLDFEALYTNAQFTNKVGLTKKGIQGLESMLDDLKKTKNPEAFFTVLEKYKYGDTLVEKNGFADFIGRSADELLKSYELLIAEAIEFKTMDQWFEHIEEVEKNIEKNRKAEELSNGIILSTFHSSKGLEWEYVFMIGLNNEITPSPRNPDEEEERRMFYVAMTRAKNALMLLTPNYSSARSKFLTECIKLPLASDSYAAEQALNKLVIKDTSNLVKDVFKVNGTKVEDNKNTVDKIVAEKEKKNKQTKEKEEVKEEVKENIAPAPVPLPVPSAANVQRKRYPTPPTENPFLKKAQ